ncbi:MAG: hypothetical protein KAR06_06850 [Deltaproteobacteria bacterium]|nr:hypothetical protein [Deltaproteobacteria bacterium]
MKVKGRIETGDNICYFELKGLENDALIDGFYCESKWYSTINQAKQAAEDFAEKHNFEIEWEKDEKS